MENRLKIEAIKARYLAGEISFDDAKSLVAPILNEINRLGVEIAKKHNRSFNKMSFGYIFR